MKSNTLGMWTLRLIFCIFVILAYNMFNNFGTILSWFGQILSALTSFIIGGVIAFLLFPICKKLETLLLKTNKKFIVKRVRGIATLIIVLMALIIVGLISFFMFPIVYDNLVAFVKHIPQYAEDIDSFMNNLSSHFGDDSPFRVVIDNIKDVVSLDNITRVLVSLDYNSYLGGLTSLFFGVFNFLIGAIISIYLLLDRSFIKRNGVRMAKVIFKDKTVSLIGRLGNKVAKVIYTFIFGQVIDAFMIACFIGMFLTIFGVDNSVVLALTYFACGIIPYFGSIIGVCVISLFSLIFGGVEQFFIVFIIAAIFQQLDSNFISPRVVGQAVGIGPLYVILGIALFGGIFGIYGLFLGPPLMAICMELADDFISSKEIKRKKDMECLESIGIFSKIKNKVDHTQNFDDSSDDQDK